MAMDKITVTLTPEIVRQARRTAETTGQSLSALTDRALRDYLLGEAMAAPQPVDQDWLTAVAETIEQADGQAAA